MRQQTPALVVPVRLTLLVMLSALISGLVSVLAFPPPLAAAAPATTNSDVNLRAGPGESFDILTVVPAGGAVSVDGDAVDGFSPVTYNGMNGWVSVSFLIADGSGATAPMETSTYQTQPSVSTTGNATVVFDDAAGDSAQQGNRRDRDGGGNQPSATPPLTNPGTTDTSEQGIIDIIHQAAAAYGQSPDDMVRVARCESSLNPRAVDPSGSYHGLFQFVPSTFAGTPYGGQDIYDPWANAHAAAWMWSEGRKYEWVCQ
ncbi:MAG: transglycosylase SLT domain-containing protein [Chloroflexota bacterium]|nr:transglycosylase SLT domain-containing protein [Chloroflexota bacterium]